MSTPATPRFDQLQQAFSQALDDFVKGKEYADITAAKITVIFQEVRSLERDLNTARSQIAQAKQDIADLNTRLIERQQDMMARIVQLRNDLRAATRNAINLAHEAISKEEEDPYESEDYQRFVAQVAETCQAPDSPCDSCLAGGICDGPNRTHDHDEHISDDDHE